MIVFVGSLLFWLLLSQKYDLLHVLEGSAVAFLVAFISHRYLNIGFKIKSLSLKKTCAYVAYCFWLVWQIIDSNIKIIPTILFPKKNLSPRFFSFECELPNQAAHLTLANSITLTPGTITVDLNQKQFCVHAINQNFEEALFTNQTLGEMPLKVQKIFKQVSTK